MSFLLGFAFALILMPAARRFGVAMGLVDRPGALKIHPRPVSVLGGPAVVAAAIGAVAVLQRGFPPRPAMAVVIAVAAGLVDDAWPLTIWIRLVILAGAGLVLASAGLPGVRPGAVELLGVTALALATTNGVNLIDGQDMLAAGLAAIAAIVLAALLLTGGGYYAKLGFGLGGALVAFLIWNRPPARIFLGNGGAYGVGLLLALLAAANVARGGWNGLLASGVCLGVFALELVLTVVRRLVARQPIGPGDRAHSYDVLANRWGSRQRSTAVLWAVGAAAGCTAFLVSATPLAVAVVIAVLSAATVAAATLVLWSGAIGMMR